MIDTSSQFRDAIRATGLEPPDIFEPGKVHRFPGVGKQRSNRAGWCLLFNNGLGGCFGDWSTSLSQSWQAKRDKPYSKKEVREFILRSNEAKAQAEKEREARQANAAYRALEIWNSASAAPSNHPYLIRKAIKANGARFHKGALMLPIEDFCGNLKSLQFIAPDGRKLLLSGGRKRGCFIPVVISVTPTQKPQNMAEWCNSAYCVDIAYSDSKKIETRRIVICEGWATGCTLAEGEPNTVVLAAIDAGNLQLVAMAARHHWPSAELVIAGDDDRLTTGNPGATKARAAAIATDALLALPQWPEAAPENLTDFNDLAVWLEREAV